jgi:hypothetical protein
MNSAKQISYIHTLIFSIIAGIVSVALLLVLLIKKLQSYTPFVVTLEIGIFIIVFSCLIQIWLNEMRLANLRKNGIPYISFDSCPDYYVKRVDGDKEFCSNEYVYQDKTGKKYIMKIYPTERPVSLPAVHNQNMTTNSDQPYDKFYLRSLESDPTLKSPSDKCAPLFTPPTDPNLSYLKGYDLLPWTTMRSKCEATTA